MPAAPLGLRRSELRIFGRLKTPAKIQDYLEALRFNFGRPRPTCLSPRQVVRRRRANCMEGAMFAAAVLWFHGERPLVMDLRATAADDDHVVALFRRFGRWGAISKTNHAVLRYREPVYRTIRELALSYFHEYFLPDGRKSLRSYSRPVNLARFRTRRWVTADDDLWDIPEYLDAVPHELFLSPSARRALRRADPIEIAAGRIIQWRR